MLRLKPSLSFLLMVMFSCQAFSQNLPVKQALETWTKNFPQEKLFVQTDKSYYMADETIWMKAWCTTVEGPSYLSRIAYIELVDGNGKVVQKKMYKLDSLSSTAADIQIPEELPSGNYSLNAYTLWMLNFPDFIFKKNIFIYGKDYKSQSRGKPVRKSQLKISFFPEGGDMISGVANRIAFKATDTYGYPMSFSGTVSDDAGNKIADIVSEHDGMGVFDLKPEAGKKYKVSVTAGGTAALTFPLPAAKTEGISLKVLNTNPNRIFISVSRANQNKEKYNDLTVVAQMNYQVIYSAKYNVDEGLVASSIPKKQLPPGVMHITVFDKNDVPLAERLIFIENYQLLEPEIKTEAFSNRTKGKNRISFSIDSTGISSISCLVTAFDSSFINAENIASSLLFSSELTGNIFNEGYYLKNKDATTLRHLDLLMMTQGWRRFEWKKLIANEAVTLKYPVESSISFRGTLYKSDRKEIVKDGKVSFLIRGVDSTSILAEAKVTDKGEFLLPDINYIKSAEVAYMGTDNKQQNFIVDVKMKPNHIDSLSVSKFRPTLDLDTLKLKEERNQLYAYLNSGINFNDSLMKVKTMMNVTVRAKKLSHIDSLNAAFATGIFLMGQSVDPGEYKHYQTIWQMLLTAVPGIRVEGNPFDPNVFFNRFSGLSMSSPVGGGESSSVDGELSTNSIFTENGIAYFINEVNVSKDVVNSLNIDDVALIKVLKNEAAGLGVSMGAIAFYTKTGYDVKAREYDKRYTKENREGYAIVREFYSPDYTLPEEKNAADNRYTLYWNGRIRPTKDGSYRFEFYNNDTNKKFRLLIQGIDTDGQIIYKEAVVEK